MNKKLLTYILAGCLIFSVQSIAAEKEDDSGRKKVTDRKEDSAKKTEIKDTSAKPVEVSEIPARPSTVAGNKTEPTVINIIPEGNSVMIGEEINWNVFATGSSLGFAPGLMLSSITGQTFVGDGSAGDIHLSTGFWQPFVVETCCVGIRGNTDGGPDDGGIESINITDLVYLIAFTFLMEPPPPCMIEADVDASNEIDIADIVYLVEFMFDGGPEPLACP